MDRSGTTLGLPSLKPAPHQVAGHRFDEGRKGSMVDEQGRFYKPLQSGDRGQAEAAFYEKVAADAGVPENIKSMFPGYFGVVEEPAADGMEADKFLVMEDLTAKYSRPCIIDIKMGRRTWFEGAPQKYIDKCLEKDKSTTSGSLGYRIAGLQAYDPGSNSLWKAGRVWCKDVTPESMPAALARFLSKDPSGTAALDKPLAEEVLLGARGLLALLGELRAWFDTQTSYQLYSASILAVYEGKPAPDAGRNVSLRLVDFAHVTEVNAKDINFLEAIDAVAAALEKLLD